VQTVAEVKPTEVEAAEQEAKANESPVKEEEPVAANELSSETPAVKTELVAQFVRDSICDGTVLPANITFEQTWVLRNGGDTAWPAGCCVKYIGGDNMCAVDPAHPASVDQLAAAAESTCTYSEVAPGEEHTFTVKMRTPDIKHGRVISFWRLTGPTGYKFGHRLWCDVIVQGQAEVKPVEAKKETKPEPETEEIENVEEQQGSQVIFPKLEHESPIASIHESVHSTHDDVVEETADEPVHVEQPDELVEDEFEDFTSESPLKNGEEESDEAEFLTDDEYDILDASDEEFSGEQGKPLKK
jgi:next-to-BRCA1 protein 1